MSEDVPKWSKLIPFSKNDWLVISEVLLLVGAGTPPTEAWYKEWADKGVDLIRLSYLCLDLYNETKELP